MEAWWERSLEVFPDSAVGINIRTNSVMSLSGFTFPQHTGNRAGQRSSFGISDSR